MLSLLFHEMTFQTLFHNQINMHVNLTCNFTYTENLIFIQIRSSRYQSSIFCTIYSTHTSGQTKLQQILILVSFRSCILYSTIIIWSWVLRLSKRQFVKFILCSSVIINFGNQIYNNNNNFAMHQTSEVNIYQKF